MEMPYNYIQQGWQCPVCGKVHVTIAKGAPTTNIDYARQESITVVNEPKSQSTEFRLVLEVLKITRCKNCKYWNRLTRVTFKDEHKGLCEYRDHIMATREDFYCADGKEKDDEQNKQTDN